MLIANQLVRKTKKGSLRWLKEEKKLRKKLKRKLKKEEEDSFLI